MIFTSKAKSGIFWNGGKPVKFVDGLADVTDEKAIAALKKAGYSAAEKEGAEDGGEQRVAADVEGFGGMTIAELKDYAVEKGIDLGNATSIGGILKKVQAAEKEGAEDGGNS